MAEKRRYWQFFVCPLWHFVIKTFIEMHLKGKIVYGARHKNTKHKKKTEYNQAQ